MEAGSGRTPEKLSRSARVLTGIAQFAWDYPVSIIVIGIVLCLASMLYTWQSLTFDPNRSNLIRRTPELEANLQRYLTEFPKSEDLVVVVEGGGPGDRKAFVDDLAKALRSEPETFRDVFERVELPFLRTHALHYLDVAALKNLGAELENSLPLLRSLSSSNNMVGLLDSFGGATGGPGVSSASTLSEILPFLNEAMGQLLVSLETRGRYEYRSPWAAAFFGDAADRADAPEELESAGETVFYNTIADGKLYLLLVRAAHGAGEDSVAANEAAVVRIRQLILQVQRAHPQVQAGLTGEPVLDTDEMMASTNDSTKSTLLSLVGVALVFALSFRELFRPLMAVVALILGVGWTMGFTTLVVGHLNLLTVTFATILVGLGIDFGIHFIYRYDEERHGGQDPLTAMKITLATAGVENLTGAVSTAIAFWALNFTDFVGIAELGTIAGTGIMLCYLAMVTVLPAFLFLQERWSPEKGATGISKYDTLARMEQTMLSYPWIVTAFCVVFSVWCFVEAGNVRYDYNLLNLQAKALPSVQTELHMINTSDRSLLSGISVCDDVAQAKRLAEAYRKLPTVSFVESLIPMIPEDYAAKKPSLERIVAAMRGVPEPAPPEERTGSMARNLQSMAGSFLDLDRTFREAYPALIASSDPEVRKQAAGFKQNLDRLFTTLESMGPGPIEDGLTTFQKDFFTDLGGLIEFLKDQTSAPPVTLQDVPQVLREREVGVTGKIQIRIYPKENVWERKAQERFVQDLQSVDPSVVGMPVMMYYDTQELRTANEDAGWYALGAICLILLVHFRSLKIALLALFPKAVGVLWMVGIMGFAGVNFNSANFLALPLILGIGLVFGVHVVHRVQEEGSEGLFGHSTGPSIALAALTTMIGFGTMIPARHQGIATLGFVMTVGVGANLLASIVFLPAVLRILARMGISVKVPH